MTSSFCYHCNQDFDASNFVEAQYHAVLPHTPASGLSAPVTIHFEMDGRMVGVVQGKVRASASTVEIERLLLYQLGPEHLKAGLTGTITVSNGPRYRVRFYLDSARCVMRLNTTTVLEELRAERC